MTEGDKEILNGELVLLREAAVENENVVTEDENKVKKCKTDVWKRVESLSVKKFFLREADEKIKGLCDNKGNYPDGFQRKEIVKEGEMGVRIGLRVFICSDQFAEEGFFYHYGRHIFDG